MLAPVDVLIVTALPEELDAVLEVEEGAISTEWKEDTGPLGLKIRSRTFRTGDEQELKVAVIKATGMNTMRTAAVAASILAAYDLKPLCLAMCGVCAGRRGDVNLGDVIFADRVWTYDEGKIIRQKAKSREQFQGDEHQWQLHHTFKEAAQNFRITDSPKWLETRPEKSIADQATWVLRMLFEGKDPSAQGDRRAQCPDWTEVIKKLLANRFVSRISTSLRLEEKGRSKIEEFKLLYPDGPLPKQPFRTHLGPIGSGIAVRQDVSIFDRLSLSMRKVIGLEMEAAAIGEVASLHDLPRFVVAKGVMDFGDNDKEDGFKKFAARASAECLLLFLRKNLTPRGHVPGFDDILSSGSSTAPGNAPPSSLLNARYQIVPFSKQRHDLGELKLWCERDPPIDAKLICGAGGTGKTRLMIECCRYLREKGWLAGFLQKSTEGWFERLWSQNRSMMVVVDYAESCSFLSETVAHFIKSAPPPNRRLRLVLLARNAEDWWEDLLSAGGRFFDLFYGKVKMLEPIAGVQAREDSFKDAIAAFAKKIQISHAVSPPDLSAPQFERTLYIHMAALAALKNIPFSSASDLLDSILSHEENFWKEQNIFSIKSRAEVEKMRRLVLAATLRGGLRSQSESREIAEMLTGQSEEELIVLLHYLYPHPSGRLSTPVFISGLEPDTLGEGIVLRYIRKSAKYGEDPSEILGKIFFDSDRTALRRAFELLGGLTVDRSSESQTEEVNAWIRALLKRELDERSIIALEAAKAIGTKTVQTSLGDVLTSALDERGDRSIAAKLEPLIPADTVILRELALWVARSIFDALPERRDCEINDRNAPQISEWAKAASNLSLKLAAAGKTEDALLRAQQTVDAYRKLTEKFRSAFLPFLAGALSNLSNVQLSLGQVPASCASAQAGVNCYEEAFSCSGKGYAKDYSACLSNLSDRQRLVGDSAGALSSAQKSVEIYSDLMKTKRATAEPFLAKILHTLGVAQSACGQWQEAEISFKDSIGIFRSLARENPDEHLVALALGLIALGALYLQMGNGSALEIAAESVSYFKRLTPRNLSVMGSELAMSLSNLSGIQVGHNLFEDSLSSAQQAVDICERMAERNRPAILHVWGASTLSLSIAYFQLGSFQESYRISLVSRELYREAMAVSTESFLPPYTKSLFISAMARFKIAHACTGAERLRTLDYACESFSDVVETQRRLEKEKRIPMDELIDSLNMLALAQSEKGNHDAAKDTIEEAVAASRALIRPDAPTSRTSLFVSLWNRAIVCSRTNLPEQTEQSLKEALDLCYRLVADNRQAFLRQLADLASDFATFYAQNGKTGDAMNLRKIAADCLREIQGSKGPASRQGL